VAWDNALAALLSALAKVEAQKISDRTEADIGTGEDRGRQNRRAKARAWTAPKECQRPAKGEIRYATAVEGGSSDIPPVRSNSTHEKEHEEDDQNDANDTDAAVTVAIAVAAEPATEATNQEDDENDDKNQSQWWHGLNLLWQTASSPPSFAKTKKLTRSRYLGPLFASFVLISGLSYKTMFSNELWISSFPLYLI
jgi:hypothetical protein